MSEYQEFTGKTVEEALRAARDAFGGAGLDELDFEILTPGSRGVLGMGAEPARIIAAPRSALGGAAPRREAAAQTPLPPPPPREPRPGSTEGGESRGYERRGPAPRSRRWRRGSGDRYGDRPRTPRPPSPSGGSMSRQRPRPQPACARRATRSAATGPWRRPRSRPLELRP